MTGPGGLLARSRYFNAVTLVLDDLEQAASRLGELPESREVEVRRGRLTVFPSSRGNLFEAVTGVIQAEGWKVDQIQLEPGRMDEVFRTVTGKEAALMNNLSVVMRRELASYFATPVRLRLYRDFPADVVDLHVLSGRILRARNCRSRTVFSGFIHGFTCSWCRRSACVCGPRNASTERSNCCSLCRLHRAKPCWANSWLPGCFVGLALILTFPIWLTVNVLGDPDNGVILAAYMGSWLMAGGFLAISACFVGSHPQSSGCLHSVGGRVLPVSCCPVCRWYLTCSAAGCRRRWLMQSPT